VHKCSSAWNRYSKDSVGY